MDLVRVIKQLEMTNIYLINGINAESRIRNTFKQYYFSI